MITEYGIANLFGKSIRERAVALIEVAHPRWRDELLTAAKKLDWRPPNKYGQANSFFAVHVSELIADS